MSVDNNVIDASIAFMHALTKEYGAVEGKNLYNKISEFLPEEISEGIMFRLLMNPDALSESGKININIPYGIIISDRVGAVKMIRANSGCGLKEALDILKSMESGVTERIFVKDVSHATREFRKIGVEVN